VREGGLLLRGTEGRKGREGTKRERGRESPQSQGEQNKHCILCSFLMLFLIVRLFIDNILTSIQPGV